MTAAVSVDGNRFRNALDRLGKDLESNAAFVAEDSARYAQKHATQTRLFERRTGRLHMGTEAVFIPDSYASYIINSVPYARYIEEGTKPHTIYPSHSDKLRFYWEKIGQWVEFAKVDHPGTKPYPFFKSAGYLTHTFMHERLERHAGVSIARYNEGK